eukprot:gene8218-1467_t
MCGRISRVSWHNECDRKAPLPDPADIAAQGPRFDEHHDTIAPPSRRTGVPPCVARFRGPRYPKPPAGTQTHPVTVQAALNVGQLKQTVAAITQPPQPARLATPLQVPPARQSLEGLTSDPALDESKTMAQLGVRNGQVISLTVLPAPDLVYAPAAPSPLPPCQLRPASAASGQPRHAHGPPRPLPSSGHAGRAGPHHPSTLRASNRATARALWDSAGAGPSPGVAALLHEPVRRTPEDVHFAALAQEHPDMVTSPPFRAAPPPEPAGPVSCYHCNIPLVDWGPSDDPAAEHR